MDILFAENSKREVTELGSYAVKDLALQEIVEALSGKERDIIIIREILSKIPKDINIQQTETSQNISRPQSL